MDNAVVTTTTDGPAPDPVISAKSFCLVTVMRTGTGSMLQSAEAAGYVRGRIHSLDPSLDGVVWWGHTHMPESHLDRVLASGLTLVTTLRNPLDVIATWERRGKGMHKLRKEYDVWMSRVLPSALVIPLSGGGLTELNEATGAVFPALERTIHPR